MMNTTIPAASAEPAVRVSVHGSSSSMRDSAASASIRAR